MKTSIATVSISGALDAKLHAIAASGFDGVEIFENDLLSSHLSSREIGALMGDLGLACTLFQPFRDLEGLPDPLRQRAFDRLERKFDVMAELGTNLLLVCSSCSPAADGDRQRLIADLHEAGERAARRGLRIGYEALAWGRHVNDHREAWGLVRDADHPGLGLVLDSFHSLARAIPSSSIRDIRSMVGMGGVGLEVMRDRRLFPSDIGRTQIRGELEKLAAAPLLHGTRGQPGCDVDSLIDVVDVLAGLMEANPHIREFEINPLVLYPEGRGHAALDALAIVETGGG